MKGRVVVARAIRRGFTVTALVVGVALSAGPSAADHGPHVLSIDDPTVVEGDLGTTDAVFTVTLSPADATNTITVAYTTSDGSASAGSDYGMTTGLLTFVPNDTEETITVPVIGDTIDEADESFSVELSAPVNAGISDGTGVGTITDDDSAPNVSIGDASAVTEGGVASFPVTLSAPSGQTVTVDFSSSHVTTSEADLTGSTSGTVTFSPGDTSEQIQIQTLNDALDEADAETFTVTLSTPSNAAIVDGSGTGTIDDNDPLPSVSIGDALAVTEGSSASFPVTLSAASGRAVTVDYSTSHVSTNAADLSGTTGGTITFAAGDTSETISIATVNDTADEADSETFTVTLSAPTNATLGTPVTGTNTINDNDAAPTLSIASATPVTEGATATFTVTLSAASDQTVTVDYASANVSTASGDFLGPTSGTLTFLPGDTSQPVSIGTNDDALDEATETFTVTLSAPANATILDGSGTGTINDNDPTPTVSIGDALAVTEGAGASFPVTLSAASGQTVTVNYSTSHGTTSAADLTGPTSGTVTFAAGDTTETISIATVNDTLDEADTETFTVTLSAPANATILDGSGTGTITDNDPTPTVSIADAPAITEGGSAFFPVTLSAASAKTVTVDYATTHGTTSGADFTSPLSGTLTIAPGTTSDSIELVTVNDLLDEADPETFTLTLSVDAGSNATLGTPSTGAGAINDNDAEPQLSIADAAGVSEGGLSTFTVTLSPASGQTVTVSYASANGSAIAPGDYTAASGSVTFNAGETSKQIQVQTLDDAFDEPTSESFTVTLSAPANATILDGSGTGTINDNDPTPTVSIGDALAVSEGGGASFPVTLSAASGQTVTVSYSSANGTAVAPGDYTAVSGGTVTFNPGETSKQILIQTSQDLLDEPDSEAFTVTLSTPSNATILNGSGTGTIADDDPLPAVSIGDAAAVSEGGLAAFTVTLSTASGRTVTVAYSLSHGTTSAADFAGAISGTVTFNPGDTSEQINVSTVDDTVDEPDTETFSVNLAAPSNTIIGDGSGAGAITDNDATPTVSIGDALAVGEGGTASFPVTLSAASGQTVTVNYSTSHGTTSAADLTGPTSGTVTFAAGDTTETIGIATVNDTLDEADTETFTVTLATPVNATILDGSATGTITDNDPTPTVSIGDAPAITEGGTASFPITLSAASGQTVTVNYTTTHVSTSAADFSGTLSGTVTFNPGATNQSIVLSTVNDLLDEADSESFTVTLSSPSNASLGTSSATGSIADDDPLPAVSIGDAAPVSEGGLAAFTVTLSTASGRTVTVAYSLSHGTTSAADFAGATSGTVTFNPGDTSEQVNVSTVDDTVDEPDSESFTVNLAAPVHAIVGDGSGAGAILDDDATPTLSIADAPSVTEGGLAGFAVTLSAASGQTVTVQYSTGNGSAVAPGDFNAVTGGTLTFVPGDTSETVSIQTLDDTFDEALENFAVTLAAPTNATIADGSGTGTISDNDPTPTVSIGNAPAVTEGGLASFPVTLSAASGQTVTVQYSTTNGSAVAPGDYTAVTGGSVSFAPGETTKSILITTVDDLLDEALESFTVTLAAPTNATIALGQGTGTGTITDNDSPPTVSIADAPTVTEGSNASFPVTLSAASGQTVTVNYSTANGSAVAPGDYTAVTGGSVTFAPGETSKQVQIQTQQDTLDEADPETFTVTLASPVNATLGTSSATGSIADDDPLPAVSIADAAPVSEGGLAAFTVTLSTASGRTVTVAYSLGHGTTSAADFAGATSGTVTFNPGDTSEQVNVSTVDDIVDEPDSESFTVNLAAPVHAIIGDGSGAGAILDDDATPTLSIADATAVTEGGLAGFAVTLSAASGQTVTVQYSTVNGSAVAPGDFNAVTGGTVTFVPGDTSETVSIQTLDDTFDEALENFAVTLAAPTNATIADGSGTGTIADNDPTPSVSIADALPVTEGGLASFTVTLSAASGQTVTVNYSTANGSAVAPGDYTAVTGGSVSFAPGETSKQVSISTVNDTLDEEDTETFTVTLSLLVNATVADGSATGTIADDDPLPAVSIADAAPVDEGGIASFTVSLSAPSARIVTVDYTTVNGSAGAPGDYTAESGSLTFVAGDTTETVTIATNEDALDEINETFSVSLSTTAGSNATIADGTANATIVDNDGPAISINDVTVDEAAGNAVFTVSLSAPSPQTITVQYTTANGSAISGSDFTGNASPLTLTIPANQPSGAISIPITNDTTDEVDETFVVNLANPTNATISDSQGQATIVDDDGPTIAVTDPSANENAGSTVFTVTLSAPSVQTVTVQYATADGSATSPLDYTGTTSTQTLTYSPGQTSKSVVVPIIEDSIDEVNETFTLDLSNPTNAFFGDNQGVATIIDNDGPTVSIGDVTVTEGDSTAVTAVFNVTLSAPSPQPVSVNYATANGTATAGVDYTAASGTLTFAPGEASKTLAVSVLPDTLDEADETFFVNLSGATNASPGDMQGQATITDNDPFPTLSIADSLAVDEGNSGVGSCAPPVTPPLGQCASFTVTLSAVSGRTVSVAYATASDSATSNVDFDGVANTLSFEPGQTVKTIFVPIRGDTLSEANETFFVNLSSPANAAVGDGQGLGTITDDDPLPTLSISDFTSLNESGNLTFTVTLSQASGQLVTVNYATADGTATAGADYQAQTGGLLQFSIGQTSKTIDVPVLPDTLDENAETLTVTLSNASGASIQDGTGLGTITDDDPAPSVSIGDAAAVAEGGQATFPITLSGASGKPISIQYSTGNGTASSPGDFNSVSAQTVTFNPGETSKQVQIQTNDDTFDEPDAELFTVTLSGAVNVSIADGSATGTINDNDPLPQVTIANAVAVTEGSVSTFTVTLTPASGRTVTVSYATANGSAVTPGDYTAVSSGSVTFNAGETTKQISIATVNDTTNEAQETFTVGLSVNAGSNAVLGAQSTGTGTINDNDPVPTVSIQAAAAVMEGAQSVFNVNLSAASGQTVTVSYSTGNGTAAAPGDFNAVTGGTVTFVPGDTSEQIRIQTLDDLLDEADGETFTVALSGPVNATLAGGPATGTINDNDTPPTVTIANAPAVTEGGTASFAVTLSAATGQTVTVAFTTTHVTTAGADFGSPTSGTVTFAPSDPLTKQLIFLTNDDVLDEADSETFTVALSSPTNAVLGTPSSATGTINDNDQLPTISIGDTTVLADNTTTPARVGEGDTGQGTCAAAPFGQCAAFTLTLSAASGRSVTIDFATSDGTATDDDYVPTTGSVTLAAGETSKLLTVPVKGDFTDELNETFNVTLSATPTSNVIIADGQGIATIVDDDGPPALSVTGAEDPENSTEGAIVVVALSPASAQPVTVTFATANGTAMGGSDFVPFPPAAPPCSNPAGATSCTLTFATGQTSKGVTIDLVDDALDEENETFSVNLSNPENAVIRNDPVTGRFEGRGNVTIVDDDDPPSLSVGDVTVTEGNAGSASASFAVTLSGPSGKQITTAYATADGTATQPDDYSAVSGTLTFAPGETSKLVTVAVHGDGAVEPDESFSLNLSGPTNATIADAQGIRTITNDDTPPAPPPPPAPTPPPTPPPPPVPPPPDPTTTSSTSTSTTTTTSPPPPPPVLTGMAVSTKPVTLVEDFAPIAVTCSKKAKGTCLGTVTLQGESRALSIVGGRPAARLVRLGREEYAIQRGKTERVLVRVSKRAVKALTRHGKLKVTLVLTARDSSGKRAKPIKRALWLKAPKQKKGKATTPARP